MTERPMMEDVETPEAAYNHIVLDHPPYRASQANALRSHAKLHADAVCAHRHPSEPARDVDGRLAGDTASGHTLTEGDVERLAAEAEAGYDVDRLLRRGAKLTRENVYPEVDKAADGGSEIVQVVMHASFYNAFFVPLLKQQDFGLIEFEPSKQEKEAGLRTFGMTLGPSRAQMLKDMS